MRLLQTTENQELILLSQRVGELPLDRCKGLLELWKKRTANPQWEQVIQALREVKLVGLAATLEGALSRPNGEVAITPSQSDSTNGVQTSGPPTEQGEHDAAVTHMGHLCIRS